LARLSVLTVDRGQYRRALALAQKSWLAAKEYEFNKFIALNCLGVALHALEKYEEARAKFQMSLELLEELKLESWVPEQIYRIGKIAYQMGDYACAYQQFHESLTKSNTFGLPALVVKNHYALSRVCIAQCHNAQAKEHLQTALKEIVRLNRPPIQLAVLTFTAELLVEECELEDAVLLATFVSNHSASQAKVKERATSLLTRLEALLPTGEFNKAQQASQQTDLESLATHVLIDLERL
jgi:tetratricopeptide (TPR) repeat protein